MFLMTDAQIPEERFLVLINDLLASGEISELFPDDELENIVSAMRNVVKGLPGIIHSHPSVSAFSQMQLSISSPVKEMSDGAIAMG